MNCTVAIVVVKASVDDGVASKISVNQPQVCQVAVVLDVAVSTWPDEGAVAADTSIVVVAEFSASVSADLPVISSHV